MRLFAVWTCPNCHNFHDRDGNASINLMKQAKPNRLAVSFTESINACGEESSDVISNNNVKLFSGKQEPNILDFYIEL